MFLDLINSYIWGENKLDVNNIPSTFINHVSLNKNVNIIIYYPYQWISMYHFFRHCTSGCRFFSHSGSPHSLFTLKLNNTQYANKK